MLRIVLAAAGIVDIAFGAALLVAPVWLLAIYGMSTDRDGTFMAQFVGATLAGFGVLEWFAQRWPDGAERRLLIRVLFVTATLGFVVSLGYQLQAGVPALTAAFVGLTLVFAIAFGYFAYRYR